MRQITIVFVLSLWLGYTAELFVESVLPLHNLETQK